MGLGFIYCFVMIPPSFPFQNIDLAIIIISSRSWWRQGGPICCCCTACHNNDMSNKVKNIPKVTPNTCTTFIQLVLGSMHKDVPRYLTQLCGLPNAKT